MKVGEKKCALGAWSFLLGRPPGLSTETIFLCVCVFVFVFVVGCVLADAIQGEARRRSRRSDFPEGQGYAGWEAQRKGESMMYVLRRKRYIIYQVSYLVSGVCSWYLVYDEASSGFFVAIESVSIH